MVDRVYKADLPALRESLERLKAAFSELQPQTDWTKLRVEPVLNHARQLERLLRSRGSSRLPRGVRLFHSDLVYLRENVRGLSEILRAEEKASNRRGGRPRK
jgi:hypothetical protein